MLYCINHKDYRGKNPPVIQCKNCCKIFISKVKSLQDKSRQLQIEELGLTHLKLKKYQMPNTKHVLS